MQSGQWTSVSLQVPTLLLAIQSLSNKQFVSINFSSPFQRDEAQLRAMMNCDKYSMPFKVVVKPIAVLPRALQKSINDDVRVKSMFDQLESFIETDSKQTEAEIRRLQMEMNNRRQEAEIDFQRIAAVIELFNGTIASTMSTDSCELTPPVTPESVNDKMMSMDNQIPHDKLNGKRDGSSKHSSAINPKLITKTIDFEEDVFAFDGMQEEATNEADRYHKYSDTEEGSDGENTVEMRAYNRGRSGSVNIARSAPISMPRFPYQRVDIDTDDEKSTVEQEMDIASSMKILARSVRADNIFGELPAPPVLRHNAEY